MARVRSSVPPAYPNSISPYALTTVMWWPATSTLATATCPRLTQSRGASPCLLPRQMPSAESWV